jgi:hypothetical protein
MFGLPYFLESQLNTPLLIGAINQSSKTCLRLASYHQTNVYKKKVCYLLDIHYIGLNILKVGNIEEGMTQNLKAG